MSSAICFNLDQFKILSSGNVLKFCFCINQESREKFRGWVSVSIHNDVDVSFKKVGDGHPLRLWKCTVDVEAPPDEVLNRILHER